MSSKKSIDAADSDPSKDSAKRSYTIRLESEDIPRLEKCAEIYRQQTGSKETAAGLARTFILIGLGQFERTGGLVVNQ